jgi:CheY-like chemotaxis protein
MARILLVDDTPLVRKTVGRLLAAHGHAVTTAADGEEAIAATAAEGFDLAIVDIWMPRLDGLGLLRQFNAGRPALPVIMISGGGPKAPLEYAMAVAQMDGAAAVLVKPFEDDQLLSAVDQALNRA